jgi:hypothetical protein
VKPRPAFDFVALAGMLIICAVLWVGCLLAVAYVFGCSLSLEVESEMHHHEAEGSLTLEATPTPAPHQ